MGQGICCRVFGIAAFMLPVFASRFHGAMRALNECNPRQILPGQLAAGVLFSTKTLPPALKRRSTLMPFQIRCACGKNLSIQDEWVGKKIRCSNCNEVITASPPDEADDDAAQVAVSTL